MATPRPLFILNPAAGKGRAASVLANASFPAPAEIAHTAGPGDGVRIARQAALDGYSPVVAVGGDGTIHEVVNGLMQVPDPPPLGIVPAGGGNDTVRSLGLPKRPDTAVQRIWSNQSSAIDIGKCNNRHFINVGGAGLDTVVAAAVNASPRRISHSQIGFVLHALDELRRFDNPRFRISIDGQAIDATSPLVAVANLRYFARGMKIAPTADPTDGLFDIWFAGDLSRRETLILLPTIFVGKHGRHRKVSHHRARTVRVESDTPLAVQLDGEIVETLPATFQVIPHALRIAGLPG